MSLSLSGTNFETRIKGSSWKAHHGNSCLRTLSPSLAWFYFSSYLLSKSFRYLKPYYPPSNCFWLLLHPRMKWWSNDQNKAHILTKQNVCFEFQKLLWRKLKNTKYFNIFFSLSFSHIYIYIHTHTFVQKLCCGIGYFSPLEMVLNSGILKGENNFSREQWYSK